MDVKGSGEDLLWLAGLGPLQWPSVWGWLICFDLSFDIDFDFDSDYDIGFGFGLGSE